MILRIVKTGRKIGEVDMHNGTPVFLGAARAVFKGPIERVGAYETARSLLEEGWSNGYLVLADE